MADTVEAQCREALSAEAFARAWDEGVSLDAIAAADWALRLFETKRSSGDRGGDSHGSSNPAPFPNRFHNGRLDPPPHDRRSRNPSNHAGSRQAL